MAVAALVNVAMPRYLLRVAQREGSAALQATSTELATDVVTACGVVLGLSLVWMTGWRVLDPLIGLMVGGVLLVTGTRVAIGAVRDLTDASIPEPEIETIREVLDEHADAFIEYHDLRARHVGSTHDVDLHLVVPRDMSVEEAHHLSSHLEEEISEALPQSEVVIHVEPDNEAHLRHDNH